MARQNRALIGNLSYRIPQVLLMSFAILSTLSLAVLTVSARAKSDMDTCTPAAAMPTTDAAMLKGSAIRRYETRQCTLQMSGSRTLRAL
jgi:hypothetical protein